MRRKSLLCCLLLFVCTLGFVPFESAAAWPNKSVKVVVPFNPGGGTDQQARLIEKDFREEFGQPFTFIYKPGADGAIGATELASTRPDGYTVAVHTFPLIIMNILSQKGQYAVDSFDYLAVSSTDVAMLVTRKDSPITSFDDFIAQAKAAPGRLTVGCAETLGATHMAALKLLQAGLPLNVVPMAGGAKGMAAVLGGHIDAYLSLQGAAQTASSKLKYLAVANDKRVPGFEDVPTFVEKGYPVSNMAARIWIAPKGLPEKVKARLVDGLRAIYAKKDVIEKHEAAGQPVDFRDGAELAKMIDSFSSEAKSMSELYRKTQQ